METKSNLFEKMRDALRKCWEDVIKIQREDAKKNWYQKYNKRRGKGKR